MPIDGIDLALVGDLRYGRTAHSLAWALSLYNVRLHTVAPLGLELPETLAAELTEKGMEIIPHSTVADLVSNVDVLYVTRVQRERFPDTASYFNVSSSYRITPEILAGAKENLIILHPLPRVDEIDPRVDDSPHARYFDQSKNGIPVRMAMLLEVMQ
jgi:aspartate carbamoyltransferase catalytic subunit